MINLYVSNSSLSSRKAKSWLIQQNIEFKESNLTTKHLTKKTFIQLLSLTETGVDELISKRNPKYLELKPIWNTLTLNQIFNLINEYPKLLKKPLIFDEKRLQIGFNVEEIRVFIPKEVRTKNRDFLLNEEETYNIE